MEETPREIQMVESYLEDIKQQVEQLSRVNQPGEAEKQANKILKGDVALVAKELDKAEAKGYDATAERALMLFEQGGLAMAVLFAENSVAFANSTGGLADIILKGVKMDSRKKKWASKGIQWLQESIRLVPAPEAYYNLGLLFTALKRKDQAISAFRYAEQGDDPQVSIDASKEIARLEQKKGFCFVATACYGDYDHPDVIAFRRFRDERLLATRAGTRFVRIYYAVSPRLAQRIGNCDWLSRAIRRGLLEPLVRWLSRY